MVEREFPEFSVLPTKLLISGKHTDTNQWESLGIIYTIQETSGSVVQEYSSNMEARVNKCPKLFQAISWTKKIWVT